MGILHIQIHHKLYCSFRTFAFCSPPFSIFIALLKKLLILAHFLFSQVTQKLICQKLCIDIGKIHAQLLYLLHTSLLAIENKLVELHQRQLELLALATSAGAESTEFDEEMNRVTKEAPQPHRQAYRVREKSYRYCRHQLPIRQHHEIVGNSQRKHSHLR